MARSVLLLVAATACCGCLNALENQVKKDEKSIIGKTTQDVGKFDPTVQQVAPKQQITDPVSYAPQVYGNAVERIEEGQIKHAVDLFHAEHGRYPKDYDEFMEKIIKPGIRLPVLPNGRKYAYDEVNHTLVIVEGNAAPAAAK